jgi:S-DNA-T family DNA segregation ATPase FtsK/SpoIIIE
VTLSEIAGEIAGFLLWVGLGLGMALVVLLVAVMWNLRLLVLRWRLGRFFDGDGLATVYRPNGPSGTVHFRPKVRRYKRTSYGYQFVTRMANGLTPEALADRSVALAEHLRMAEVTVESAGKSGWARVLVYKNDPAPAAFGLADFREATSASPSGTLAIPLGRRDNGEVFTVGLGHTLVVGATGSGKGSLLWAYIIAATAALGQQGSGLKLFGWDPKHAELAGVGLGRFESIAFDPGEGLELLKKLVVIMRERQALGLRAFEATAERPFMLLVVDEFNSLMAAADAAWRREVREHLSALLSQGRSAGIYVLAAAQQPQKESLGEHRPHFMNRVCLRVETSLEVNIVLGAGSVDAGAKSHLIAPATESNGYRTAGIGYARSDAEPIPVRFRAPKITDEDIMRWCQGAANHG